MKQNISSDQNKYTKLSQDSCWFPLPKCQLYSSSLFHTHLEHFPLPCSDPVCQKLQPFPTNPIFQPPKIPIDLYNHGIVFVATTAVSSQPLTPHVSDVSHTCSLIPHTIPNRAMAVPIQTFSARVWQMQTQTQPWKHWQHCYTHQITVNSMQKLDFGQCCLTSAPSLLLTISPAEMCWNI